MSLSPYRLPLFVHTSIKRLPHHLPSTRYHAPSHLHQATFTLIASGADTNPSVTSSMVPDRLSYWLGRSPVFAIQLSCCGLQLAYWDTYWCIKINRWAHFNAVAMVFKTISRLGDGWFWYAMLLLLWASTPGGSPLPMLAVVGLSLSGVGLYKLLKLKTVRPRPYQVQQVIILKERPLDAFSFPSGHTLQAVLFSVSIGSIMPSLLWVMLPFTGLVAMSRLVLGLHYPTDVAVGALIGLGLAQLTPWVLTLFDMMYVL